MHHSGRIRVACAIIERDGLVLAAQRSATMRMPGKWEFPGGKIDPGESPEGCIHRELREEMGIRIDVHGALAPVVYENPEDPITLYPFLCTIRSGEVRLFEHRSAVWLRPGDLPGLDWAAADIAVVDAYLRRRGEAGESP